MVFYLSWHPGAFINKEPPGTLGKNMYATSRDGTIKSIRK